MNRTAQCIRMLQILNIRSIMSINELADYLETNPRNIPEFRKELEVAGYFINSTPGKYGGYSLDKTKSLPATCLKQEEGDLIDKAMEYLNNKDDFLEKKELNCVIGKIMSTTKIVNS